MNFRITGVDMSTGKDRQIVIEALDEDTAVSLAKSQGVFTYSAEHVFEELLSDSPNEQSKDGYEIVIRGTAITLASVGIILAFASISPLWLLLTAIGCVILLVYINWDTLALAYTSLLKAIWDAERSGSRSIKSQQVPNAAEGMPRREKLVLGSYLGIPVILFVVFLTYWFGFRDTWEIDNYSQIADKCKVLHQAIANSNDEEATKAYDELHRFIGNHQIEKDFIVERVQTARDAYGQVEARIEQARRKREARELAEKQRREVHARAERQRLRAGEVAAAAQRSEKMYKGFTESELERVYEKLLSIGYSSEEALLTLKAMAEYPDTRAAMSRSLDND